MDTVFSASHETSRLGIMHLKRYWEKQRAIKNGKLDNEKIPKEWQLDYTLLAVLNLGLEQTIRHLYSVDPTLQEFEDWILDLNGGILSKKTIQQFNTYILNDGEPEKREIEQVLSDEDVRFWDENGYLIIRNAIQKSDCEAAAKIICDFIDADLTKPETWYQFHPAKQGVMVQLFQHELLEKNRQSDKIRKVYEQLWGRTDLWLNTDRCGFNPPATETYTYQGFPIHWDVSLKQPIPFGLQGILYLTDTDENQGAFTLVPGFHNKIEEWLNNLPEGEDPRTQDFYALGAKPIAAKAGDFIIWHHALPHGSSPNLAHSPRIVQYINYLMIDMDVKKEWL
jgi:hypothetical protein